MNYKNKDVVDKLVREHSSALVRFLTRRMKSREDAEDIAQAAYLKLYTLDDLNHLSNAKAFLFQVGGQYVYRPDTPRSTAQELYR